MEVWRMLKSATFVVALCTASATAAWAEPLVRHAGEWESTIDNGHPSVLCFPTDVTVDQNSILQQMSKLPGANCTIANWSTAGNVTTYSMQCMVGGSPMISSGTVTITGPDAFTGKSHSHGGKIPMPNGQVMAMPDVDMTTTSRRLGPCKPGDHQAPH
jgi:hypothetical protein